MFFLLVYFKHFKLFSQHFIDRYRRRDLTGLTLYSKLTQFKLFDLKDCALQG